jgi:CubicO group peptidase (beta-lactamase class C family)
VLRRTLLLWSAAFAVLAACDAAPGTSSRRSPSEGNPGDATGTTPSTPAPGDDAAKQTPGELQPPFDSSPVDSFFDAQRVAAGAPGISVAVIKGGRVRWAKGYGQANIAEQRPATKDTLYLLASVSKTVVGVALMQLLADPARGLSLESDINGSLPFSVRNPRFPDVPITFRMILTHTSSILDRDESLTVSPGDVTTPLAPFVKTQVESADGWLSTRPGTKYEYSNTAFTIAGLLVERISGLDFETYTQQRIFAPLGMTESSWFASKLDEHHLAMPYQLEETTFVPQGHYGWPTYPAGHLQTSALQLARFLAMIARGGELGGNRILPAATAKEMGEEAIPAIEATQGLAFAATPGYDGRLVLGHSGGFLGVSTEMWFDPATGAGWVLLTNGSAYYNTYVIDKTGEPGVPSHGSAMTAMSAKLLEIATALP